jgi:ribonuclease VapC
VIVVDTSAIVSILLREEGWEAVASAVAHAQAVGVSAGTLVECAFVARRRGMSDQMQRWIDGANLEVIAVDAAAARRMDASFARWGKGAHAAALNFGDLFAYDAAASLNAPLLFVGDDFNRTDVRAALAQGSDG